MRLSPRSLAGTQLTDAPDLIRPVPKHIRLHRRLRSVDRARRVPFDFRALVRVRVPVFGVHQIPGLDEGLSIERELALVDVYWGPAASTVGLGLRFEGRCGRGMGGEVAGGEGEGGEGREGDEGEKEGCGKQHHRLELERWWDGEYAAKEGKGLNWGGEGDAMSDLERGVRESIEGNFVSDFPRKTGTSRTRRVE